MPRSSLSSNLAVTAMAVGAALVAAACGADPTPTPNVAGDGETVGIHYTGTLDDGTVFDSSEGRDPLSFTLGTGQVVPGFEAAVRGMSLGETKTVTIQPDQAYGPRRAELIGLIPPEQVPEGVAVGDQLRAANGQVAVVVEITEEGVRMDANHPLAGLALTFKLELVSVE